MRSCFQQWFSFPWFYSVRLLIAAIIFSLVGYVFWQTTPTARFREEYAQAESALDAFDFYNARKHAAECIRMRPRDSRVQILAARAARRDGDLDAALDHLMQFHDLVGERTDDEMLEWNMIRAQGGKIHEVLGSLIELIEIRHPASERILEALAMGCIQIYQFDTARFWVLELLEKNPKNAVARLLRAQTTETFGHRADALNLLRELVADYPRYAKARLHLAQSLFLSRSYSESASHYNFLHNAAPGDVLPILGLARCLIMEGKTAEVEPLIGLLEQFTDNSEALLECGRFAMVNHRLPDAEVLLRRAMVLAPSDHEVHLNLGICLGQLNQLEESKFHIERAKQIELDLVRLEKAVLIAIKSPADIASRIEAGEICLRNGQITEGLRWLYGVLERKPDNKPTHKLLADFFASQGDTQQAEMHRRKAK